MFNLTKGILKDIKNRNFLTEQGSSQKNPQAKIVLRSYECPALVKVMGIQYHKNSSVIILRLFDGLDFADCCLDKNCWPFIVESEFLEREKELLNKENIEPVRDDKRLQIGTVIIFSEYSFIETNESCEADSKQNEMLLLLQYSSIGIDQVFTQSDAMRKDIACTIASLNTSLNNLKWHIKAKLLKVSVVKEFVNKNNGQAGKYIRLQFADESGAVELVAFNQEVQRVEMLREDRIYKVANADIKMSKGSVNAFQETVDSKIELVVNKSTTVIESICDEKLFKIFTKPTEKPNEDDVKPREASNQKEFVPLKDLKSKKEGSYVSVMGIVTREDELREVVPKYKAPIKLKNFYICDESSDDIKVTLWGKQAEAFVFKRGQIFTFSKVKITNFNGVAGISVLLESIMNKIEDTMMTSNVEINGLRKWWQESSVNELCNSLKRSNTFDEMIKKLEDICYSEVAILFTNYRNNLRHAIVRKWSHLEHKSNKRMSEINLMRLKKEINRHIEATCCMNKELFLKILNELTLLNETYSLFFSIEYNRIKLWNFVQNYFDRKVIYYCKKHLDFKPSNTLVSVINLSTIGNYVDINLVGIIIKIESLKQQVMCITNFPIEKFTRDIYVIDKSLKPLKIELEYELASNFHFKINEIIFLKCFKYFENTLFASQLSNIYPMPNYLTTLSVYDELIEIRKSLNR